MKAVVLTEPSEAEDLRLTELPIPEVKPGCVLIKVRAFGINHSEVLLRQFEVAQLPSKIVFAVESNLNWDEIAAVPESFYTAYGSLVLSLKLNEDDTLLIRGGTSTVGLAAIQFARVIGARVVATTRSEKKAKLLKQYGADDVILEGDGFKNRFLEKYPVGASKVLELIGASTLRESLKVTAFHGIVCHTGLLGGVYGLKAFDPIKEIPSGVYLTGFYSNYPTQSHIKDMMNLIMKGGIHPVIAERFTFENIS